ncbi:hemerythrin superfamily protein [Paraburkholderia sp. GAS448]|uniref:hemerythrin domain-containing protein n=1 Tax=Paraburkholderia sp. GAS448 TaxID=3035136 RepID=UPI003D1F044D
MANAPEKTQARESDPSRSGTRPDSDAFVLLEADHRAVEKLFTAFEKTGDDDLDAKNTLVRRACEELTIHAMIEEELLYPAAHEALTGDAQKDVDEAYVEHFLVKTLIGKFTTLQAGAKGFDATFKVMAENVKHHVEEEEAELFPELRKAGLDLVALGERITKRKAQLQAKLAGDAGDRTSSNTTGKAGGMKL